MTKTLESVFGLLHAIIKNSRHDIISGDFLIPQDYFEDLLKMRQELAETIKKMEGNDE